MSLRKVTISRAVTVADYFERVIDAPSEEAFNKAVERIASEGNKRCPDDIITSDANAIGDFGTEDYEDVELDDVEDEDAIIRVDESGNEIT